MKAVQRATARDQPEDAAVPTTAPATAPPGQVRGRGVRSAHLKRTVKHIMCAAAVTDLCAKAVHLHTALHVQCGGLVNAGHIDPRPRGVY